MSCLNRVLYTDLNRSQSEAEHYLMWFAADSEAKRFMLKTEDPFRTLQ